MAFTLFKQPEKNIPRTPKQIEDDEATSLKVFLAKHRLPETTKFQIQQQSDVNVITQPTQEPSHLYVITQCIDEVKKKQQVVKSIDKKAAAGLTIGAAALVFSFIPLHWAVTIAGFSYSFYQLGLRDNAYKEYTQSLEDLKQCCNWALNDTDATVVRRNLQSTIVQQILPTLAPLMSQTELEYVLNDKIEKNLIQETGINFEKQNHTFEYKLYGYKQGSFKDVMNGILYAIQNAFHDAVEYCAPSNSSTQLA